MAATNHHTITEGWVKLNEIMNHFEDAWQRGEPPAVSDYLCISEGARQKLLIELIHAELELRLKVGQPARVEEYGKRYRELAANGRRCSG